MSGSDDSAESLKQRFQSGDKVDWEAFANALFGSTLMLVAMTVVDGFRLLQRAVSTVLDGLSSFVAGIISLPFDRGADIFEAGAESFADWVSFLGPLAFPASVLVASVSLLVILWGVSRLNG